MQVLISDIADAVKRECTCDCAVSPHLNQVVVQIGNSGFDQHMGNLILQIQKIIDRHYPEREENLYLVIRAQNEQKKSLKYGNPLKFHEGDLP
jgi:hypothetical protein